MRWALALLVLAACSGRALLPPSPSSPPAPLASQPPSLGATQLVVGSHHACALRADGTVRCWGGDNGYGQLGDGTLATHGTPAPVTGLHGVVSLAAGGQFTCALDGGGAVWCWGENAHGTCGDGTFVNRSAPVRVPLAPASAIFASMTTACARLRDGHVRCWGDLPSRGGEPRAWGGSWPAGAPQPTPFDRATAITASIGTMCAVVADGRVRCWGTSQLGELGTPAAGAATTADVAPFGDPARASALASGVGLECALVAGGSVQCWGFAASRLGSPALTGVAELVGDDDALCGRGADGTVSCVGGDGLGGGVPTVWLTSSSTPVPTLAGAAQLAAGPYDVCARKSDGSVVCVARVRPPPAPGGVPVHHR